MDSDMSMATSSQTSSSESGNAKYGGHSVNYQYVPSISAQDHAAAVNALTPSSMEMSSLMASNALPPFSAATPESTKSTAIKMPAPIASHPMATMSNSTTQTSQSSSPSAMESITGLSESTHASATGEQSSLGEMKNITTEENVFYPDPSPFDNVVTNRSQLNPADLIPKVQGAELYSGLEPDPTMNQSFLQNRFSLGIDCSRPTRNFNNDLRGTPYPPTIANVSPFNQPTQYPDLYRKSLGDVE
ncbi:hypothetical protein BDK51DRAFT_45019 [Blyttiomyces helicus]|uniref:Minor capsid protein P11 C-terminal conserved region domain-containing protein n=1 Tax=Blyttiomyces helicus TaxID=388810 RepID=A0A4P9WL05_9FUNG|nr:hypothetical protein BDK51DRAFT_45019 [Blyttiomyces helicus]|eukprot:RKO93699.1 hypothetical protein BDK51DRAFT_45019 [Blyttiomyces helicus]